MLAIYFPKAPILGAFGLHFLGGIGLYLGYVSLTLALHQEMLAYFPLKHIVAALSNTNKKHDHYSFERKAKAPVFIPHCHIYNYVGALSCKGHASKSCFTFGTSENFSS